ncbi:hypothetical protein Pmani_014943 [Petrolisthes manimaculis]|uniref:Uncharacterized protein n=1 Tax=Petrolisthes manimaculis TaxID=1843537 RepID=A0AAE1PUH5_9EUCA|nr:hypothetical protein Pmani_014943 [Petrolisthes manimaculis]
MKNKSTIIWPVEALLEGSVSRPALITCVQCPLSPPLCRALSSPVPLFTYIPHFTDFRMRLAQQAGFEEVDGNDVTELLESHNDELTNEDLMELEQARSHEEDDDNQDESVPPKPK